jgi:glutamate transport system substrate-binding protein
VSAAEFGRRRFLALAAAAGGGLALAGCADGGAGAPPPLPGPATDAGGYDAIIAASPVADPAAIAPGSWADKVKQRGRLIRGGTDTGTLFSLRDPATNRVTGFDAGLAAMLAHYVTGSTADDAVELVITTVDTREVLLQNASVDAVFATYTINPARAQKVAFAGPYLESGAAVLVKADDTTVNSVDDLGGKTVALQANSTTITPFTQRVPTAQTLLFQDDAQCVAAVKQGRAQAYVVDQSILISDAVRDPTVKVVGEPFTVEPYGIGLPLQDASAKPFVNDWLTKIFADGSWAKLWQATVGTVVKSDPPTPPQLGSAQGS